MSKLLVTGGAGFIGSNFIATALSENPGLSIINLDLLTYAGSTANTKAFSGSNRYRFVKGDIRDRGAVKQLFRDHAIDGIVHFAAESHVDNSITGPENFITTNINGTFTLLDIAREEWLESPHKIKPGKAHCRFLHVSTDEVYGSLGAEGLFREDSPYAPNSPYSASKASSDMLGRAYFHTYGLPVVTTNCSNNYGPLQHDEKLIPTIIRKALSGQPIPIYGDGMNVRDWLYVTDHCKGIMLAFQEGRLGETYNIGGRNERNNLYIAQRICEILDDMAPSTSGAYSELITFVTDRPGHDQRYAIDATKIETELGWKAAENFETGIHKTVAHYLQKYRNHE